MKTTLTYSAILTILVMPVSFLHAQEVSVQTSIVASTSTDPVRPRPVMQGRMDIKDVRKDARVEVRDIRQERREDVKAIRQEDRTASTSAEVKAVRAEARAKVELRKADLKVEVQALKASSSAAKAKKLDEKAKERVQKTIDTVYKKLIARVNALTKVDGEITRRLASSTKSSSELSTVVALQVTAQDLLAKAKVDVEATKTTASVEVSATTSKEVIRTLVKKSEDSIKAAAEAYRKVSAELKKVNRPVKTEVTVTASSTN